MFIKRVYNKICYKGNNSHMDKKSKFFLIDTTLIFLLAASGISGLLLWTVIPRGTGLRWFFKDIHKWSGIGMAGLAFYHFMLHWDWYKKTGRYLIVGNNKDAEKK